VDELLEDPDYNEYEIHKIDGTIRKVLGVYTGIICPELFSRHLIYGLESDFKGMNAEDEECLTFFHEIDGLLSPLVHACKYSLMEPEQYLQKRYEVVSMLKYAGLRDKA
jgi:hypothetical protein